VSAVFPLPAEPITMSGSGVSKTAACASSKESGLSRKWRAGVLGFT
jgi:hypothetical protein